VVKMGNLSIIVNSGESNLAAAVSKIGVDLKVMPLTTGDAVFSKTGAMERKRGDDFVSSMKDGRLRNELQRMQDAYPDSVLCVEDVERAFATNFAPRAIYGQLAEIVTQWKVPVVFSQGIDGTANMLERLAFWTQTTPQMKPERFDRPKYSTPESYRIIAVQAAFLNTGPVLAERLLDAFKIPYNIVAALGQSTVRITPSGNLAWGKDSPLEQVQDIGPKWVLDNRQLWGCDE